MENNVKNPSKNEKVKISQHVERVNLHDFGYERSGKVKGDPDVYASYLERMINGDLVEENYKGLSEEEKIEKREQVKMLEKKYQENKSSNAKIEEEIKIKEKKVDDHRNELLHVREDRAKSDEEMQKSSFSTVKFSINLIILIMLTGYLFFFYVSAAYKALYVDLEKIATNIVEGIGTGSIMPGPYELSEAIKYNYLLFLVPFVFYAFGWAFHILLELKHKIKILFIALLISVTFTVDFLIAFIIHNNTESAKELMGLSTIKWSQSSTFYIILFLGFLVYIIWSILLDSLLREWIKRHKTNNLLKIIKHLKKDIVNLQNKLLPVEKIEARIDSLKKEINTVMYGNLRGYIDQFTSGWISYLAPENLKDLKQKCLNIKNDFEVKHKIKPGIVIVVKQKG